MCRKEKSMGEKFSKEQLLDALNKYKDKAEEILKDDEKVEPFLQNVEEKLEKIPKVGGYLAEIPVMMSMIRAKILGQFKEASFKAMVLMVAGLLYFLAPIDLLPDPLGILGYIDDAAVIGLVLMMVQDEVKEYRVWQLNNGKRENL